MQAGSEQAQKRRRQIRLTKAVSYFLLKNRVIAVRRECSPLHKVPFFGGGVRWTSIEESFNVRSSPQQRTFTKATVTSALCHLRNMRCSRDEAAIRSPRRRQPTNSPEIPAQAILP